MNCIGIPRMVSEKDRQMQYVGRPSSVVLFVTYGICEVGSCLIGGDLGSFLWVTFHFIAFPVMCFILVVMIGIRAFRERNIRRRLILISSIIFPCLILYLTYRVDLTISLLKLNGPIRP